ncbi:hypothetical protein HBI56_075800 [Parastagonospora nodorum]|nr:hypothetical protein HBH53_138820 [Parastagonospora nodorum]KAH3983582.1 hypothetical protein HBH52_061130 [Parastagonospora nodorum]KAH4003389.1 hypothetical protein HBI10_059120 [Parastagonospora nodorum]KAH4029008.1 hypothetical protein HBI13_043240 [Parastagonospora nodorum]KAH4037900.1 hypothetical protein HBI09_060420 [Parastagonospora nodorum]
MISQTLQGTVLSMTSNVLAQAISSYQDSTPFTLNIAPVVKFAIFSIISNPPNIIWQTFLEDHFPTNVPVATSRAPNEKKPTTPKTTQTSKTNVLIKFVLDQTIGALVNTLMFLAYMAYINASQQGKQDAWGAVAQECSNKTWPMMKDGYKFWPAISLISFVWIPVDKRVVFGCSVGVVWGIYLSLMADA